MNRYKLLFLVSLLVIAGLLGAYFFTRGGENASKRTVVIDSFKVFEEFQMKKDYDKRIEKEFAADQALLDSMGFRFNKLKNPTEIESLKKEFVVRKKHFDEKFQEISQKYTNEVYVRLNEYIKDFGKKHAYGIIIGSNGQGNVMYVDEAVDVTNDLVKFINEKYSN